MERQNRMIKTVAAALGAEIEEPVSSDDGFYSYDPNHPEKGGRAKPVYGADEAASLPIGLGYSIMNEE